MADEIYRMNQDQALDELDSAGPVHNGPLDAAFSLLSVLVIGGFVIAMIYAMISETFFKKRESTKPTRPATTTPKPAVAPRPPTLRVATQPAIQNATPQPARNVKQILALLAMGVGLVITYVAMVSNELRTARQTEQAKDSNTIATTNLKVPGHAQTRGHFSVWTDPRSPNPGQQYDVVVQLRLPNTITEYPVSDLSGTIVGADKYRQEILHKAGGSVHTENGVAEIRIPVPGGGQRVRDTIHVESKLLREQQTVEIEFGNATQGANSQASAKPIPVSTMPPPQPSLKSSPVHTKISYRKDKVEAIGYVPLSSLATNDSASTVGDVVVRSDRMASSYWDENRNKTKLRADSRGYMLLRDFSADKDEIVVQLAPSKALVRLKFWHVRPVKHNDGIHAGTQARIDANDSIPLLDEFGTEVGRLEDGTIVTVSGP